MPESKLNQNLDLEMSIGHFDEINQRIIIEHDAPLERLAQTEPRAAYVALVRALGGACLDRQRAILNPPARLSRRDQGRLLDEVSEFEEVYTQSTLLPSRTAPCDLYISVVGELRSRPIVERVIQFTVPPDPFHLSTGK